MTERENTDCCMIRGHTKLYIKRPCRTMFSSMNVLLAVVVILLAVLLFFSSVMLIDMLPWTKESAGRSDDNSLSQSVASTQLQSRMKSFLIRSSAVDEPVDNEFVIASRSSATQSHGSTQLFNFSAYCYWPACVAAIIV